MPIKDIIKLVAKKLARVRKHDSKTVADAASALIAKWCAAYNSTAPPVSPRAPKVTQEVVDLTQEKEKPVPRWKQAPPQRQVPKPPLQREPSVSFEDDEILRKAARQLRGGLTRVSKVAQAPSSVPDASQEASLQKHDREALLDIIQKVAKGVPIHTLVRAAEALKNTPSISNDVRSGCWRAACLELSQRTKRSGLDSPKFFDSLLLVWPLAKGNLDNLIESLEL